MGERKYQTTSNITPQSLFSQNMAAPSPAISNLTLLFQSAPTGSAAIVRCPAALLDHLRQLDRAQHITLFTPVIPHPPSSTLARNMDPFEPLGKALARPVRHVPFRLENGMTETHANFLPSAGAIVIVVCATENVLDFNSKAFDYQREFVQDVQANLDSHQATSRIPTIVFLISNGTIRQAHEQGLSDVPALVTCNNYTTAALQIAAQLIFGN
jgi:hypothetical protein